MSCHVLVKHCRQRMNTYVLYAHACRNPQVNPDLPQATRNIRFQSDIPLTRSVHSNNSYLPRHKLLPRRVSLHPAALRRSSPSAPTRRKHGKKFPAYTYMHVKLASAGSESVSCRRRFREWLTNTLTLPSLRGASQLKRCSGRKLISVSTCSKHQWSRYVQLTRNERSVLGRS